MPRVLRYQASHLRGRWVVDRWAPDGPWTAGWVDDHPPVGQPLQPPAAVQLAMMWHAEQPHRPDLGLPALGPGHLVVALRPLGGRSQPGHTHLRSRSASARLILRVAVRYLRPTWRGSTHLSKTTLFPNLASTGWRR
jgi:hypothetical protein